MSNKQKINLPEIPYREKLIYYIKKSSDGIGRCGDVTFERDWLVGRFYKFTGNQHNPDWGWVGLEKAELEDLEQLYERLYTKG